MTNLQRLLVGIIVVENSLQIDTYLFYDESLATYGAIGGICVSLATLCLAILYPMWLMESAVASGRSRRKRLHINYPLTAYIGIAVLSCLVAQDKTLAIYSITLLIQIYLIYTFIANKATRDDIVYIVQMLLITMAIQGICMIGIRMAGHEFNLGPIYGRIDPDMRVGGTIGSPNTAASYLELLIAPAVAVLATSLQRSYKLLASVACALGLIGLLLTQSRGGFIAAGLSVPLLCVIAWHRRWMSAWLPITCAVSVLFVGLLFRQSIADRVLGDDKGSAAARLTMNQMAWQAIGDNPLLGVGVNNSVVALAEYAMYPAFRGEFFYATHDKYALEWVELGPLGLAAFVWFLLWTLRAGWKTWQRQDLILAPLALGLTVAIAGQMVHMSVEIFNSRPQVELLWICAAIIAAMGRVENIE